MTVEVPTPHGPARVVLERARRPRALLMLGHGAGGGVGAPDLQATKRVALEEGIGVALVEQPYRVAGRRSAAPAAQLDVAWLAVADWLRRRSRGPERPLIAGGRSSGARVACRTAEAAGAAAVLCLAFPLQPPARKTGTVPPGRLHEFEAVRVPVLVVQGENDRFGVPPEAPGRTVVRVAGDHALKRDVGAVETAVRSWLRSLDL